MQLVFPNSVYTGHTARDCRHKQKRRLSIQKCPLPEARHRKQHTIAKRFLENKKAVQLSGTSEQPDQLTTSGSENDPPRHSKQKTYKSALLGTNVHNVSNPEKRKAKKLKKKHKMQSVHLLDAGSFLGKSVLQTKVTSSLQKLTAVITSQKPPVRTELTPLKWITDKKKKQSKELKTKKARL